MTSHTDNAEFNPILCEVDKTLLAMCVDTLMERDSALASDIQRMLGRASVAPAPAEAPELTDHIPDAGKMVEALNSCKSWFEKHSPVAPVITGGFAEHPMLTCINAALLRRQPSKEQPVAETERELQLAKLEAFAGQAGQAHLAQRLDEAVELAAEAIDLMTRFHGHAQPDDTPDMNAVFPALHFRNFVDDHARLMFKLASFKRNPVDPAFLRLKKAADEVCAVLGCHGQISARDDRVSKLMDLLYETDALKSVYPDRTSNAPQPVAGQPAPTSDQIKAAIAQGRTEALAIILDLSAEDGLDEYTKSYPAGDTGDYDTVWDEDKLADLFKADDSTWSKLQEAEGEYWHYLGLREELERSAGQPAPVAALQGAFMTLQSYGGDERSIVLKFNKKENAYAVHDYLLRCAAKDDPSHGTLPAQVAAVSADVLKRYQWLRDWYLRGGTRSEIDPHGHFALSSPDAFDKNIDAAIAASTEKDQSNG